MSDVNDLMSWTRMQIGEAENPLDSNSGPKVDQYLKAVGADPGNAWCMAFVCWCHEQAGIAGVPMTTSVRDFFTQAQLLGRLVPINNVRIGDIVLRVDYPTLGNGKSLGDHAGIFSAITDDGIPLYISGNTISTIGNVADNSDSYVDEHRLRYYNYVARFCS